VSTTPTTPTVVCDVVNEGTGRRFACQFTYTCDGRPEEMTDERALHRLGHIARIMLDGAPRDLTGGATHYHADWVNPAGRASTRAPPNTACISSTASSTDPTPGVAFRTRR
jgi:spore germination cell wall hydrolase CwlJ-like protein